MFFETLNSFFSCCTFKTANKKRKKDNPKKSNNGNNSATLPILNNFVFHRSIFNFPKNQIFLLKSEEKSILAKIESKNLYLKSGRKRNKKAQNHLIFLKYNGTFSDLFSLY